MSESILSAKDLCKSFAHNGEQNHVLNNIDLDIYKGEFTVVMGASGSGKSTLLYCLSGMDNITAGKIFYNGKCISDYKEDEKVKLRCGDFGFVFQQMNLVSNLTIFENIAVPGYLKKGAKTKNVNNQAKKWLQQVNIDESLFTRYPTQISGGEQQRVAIARAMINEPSIIFADEPTGALNENNRRIVLNLFTRLYENGQSIVMVTHELKTAVRASRIVYLEDGKILGELMMQPYRTGITRQEEKNRETQVNAWLESLSW